MDNKIIQDFMVGNQRYQLQLNTTNFVSDIYRERDDQARTLIYSIIYVLFNNYYNNNSDLVLRAS